MPDQNVEISNSRGQARTNRFGGVLGSFRIYKRGIVANESVPADAIKHGTIVGDRFEECLWAVKMAPGATGFKAHFLRWISCVTELGVEIVPGYWQEEAVVTATGSITYRQPVSGDALACYIDTIAGAPVAPGFIILRKGVVRRA